MKSHYVKIVDESILFFSRVSLSKFSLEALYFVGVKGIYTGVRKECEESIFPQQSELATWPCDLTKSRVQAAS